MCLLLFEIDVPSLDSPGARGHTLALFCRISARALQFLVQQRHLMSSIEKGPVVPRSDSSCTSHPLSGPVKGTTKRGTRGKDSSKKNNEHKKAKIIALPAPALRTGGFEGRNLPEKSDTQQARRRAKIIAIRVEGKAKECREMFHTLEKKLSSEICVPLGATLWINRSATLNLKYNALNPKP